MSATPDKYKIIKSSADRVDHRVQNIVELLSNSPVTKINTYLDFGCGDGTITTSIAEQINSKNNYAADVLLSEQKYPNLKYLQIDEKDPKIEISEAVDLITCLVSLHHLKNLNVIISEFDRISRIGTYLIIREHDATPSLQPFLDFIHLIYLIQKDLNLQEFYSGYFSKSELQRNLESHGWKYLHCVELPEKMNNPQKIYTSIFQFIGIKNNWVNPIIQSTTYKIDNGKLLKYISAEKSKTEYIKFLKKQNIMEIDALMLLNLTNLETFSEQLKKKFKENTK